MNDNLFSGISEPLPAELFTTLLTADNLRIERIFSHGQASPVGFWYDQPQHEWVLVISGAARLQIDDRTIELSPGDHVNIPAHIRHRVEWTTPDEPTLWLVVHYGRHG